MTDPPDFAHEDDRARHEALLARGYRYAGRDGLRDTTYYSRRFREAEANDGHDVSDACAVVIHRYDMSRYRPAFPADQDPISYQVEVYFNASAGHAGRLILYGFPGPDLMGILPLLEEQCVAVWRMLSVCGRIETGEGSAQ